MGTRNLTIVKSEGKTKVAQYGQWDGYPTGQGATIAKFIKRHLKTPEQIKEFKAKVDKLKEWGETKQYKDDRKRIFGEEDGKEWVSVNKVKELHQIYPALDRDHGAGILYFIQDDTVTEVKLDEEFKEDGLFCEYCYTIDLDKETVSVNDGKEYKFKEWTVALMDNLE